MNGNELTQAIADPDFELDAFVQLALRDADTRTEIAHQMLENPNIMVYYHCYYVAAKASQTQPELFIHFWPQIAALLRHPNTYHRDFALGLLANLTQVDQDDRFADLFDVYFERLRDERITIGKSCVQNSLKIIQNQPQYKNRILDLLFDIDRQCAYPEKQLELLKSDVLNVLAEIPLAGDYKMKADAFIRACGSSASPTTRRRARELVKRLGL